jgi:3-oxoacyl-[acyl-carrier-protein] synthase II
MKISIDGIGVVGGFGCGVADLMKRLGDGLTPIKETPSKRTDGPAMIHAYLADTSALETFVPKRSLRRVDHFSQMAILGAYLALQDAGMSSLADRRVGLVICTGYGAVQATFSFQDSIIDDGDICASPTLFSNSVHNAAAGHLSILLELDGPCLTVSQFEMSVPSGLISAYRWLQEDRVDLVLFGAVDEYCDVLGYCWQRFFGEDNNGVMTPLSPDIQSAIPGEGAAFFLLTKEKPGSSRYGAVVDVHMGTLKDKDILFPEQTIFLLGADGHNVCDKRYSVLMPQNSEAACYSPLYGSLPIGTAFDMAIAALSLKENRIFASPESVGGQGAYKINKQDSLLDSRSICCLKLGKEGELGMITLALR